MTFTGPDRPARGFAREWFPMSRDALVLKLSAHFPGRDVVSAFSPVTVGNGCEVCLYGADEVDEIRSILEPSAAE